MMSPKEFVKWFDNFFFQNHCPEIVATKVRHLKEYLDSASEPCESTVQDCMMNPKEFIESVEKYTAKLLEELIKAGAETHVLTSEYIKPINDGIKKLKQWVDVNMNAELPPVKEAIKWISEKQEKHELNMKIQEFDLRISKMNELHSKQIEELFKQIKLLKKENELMKFTDRHMRSDFDSLRAEFESLRHFVSRCNL